jgi:hypothetical protein
MMTMIFFKEPNAEDPLNKEAADVLQNNRRMFEHNVTKAMRGAYIGENYFDRCLNTNWYTSAATITTASINSKTFFIINCFIILLIGGSYIKLI